MAVPSSSWDETSPAGSDALNQGDNAIRLAKTSIREVVAVDHTFVSSGTDANNGKHKQVSLITAADIGTGAAGLPILGSQTISAQGELVYTNESNTDIQITKQGGVNASALKGVYAAPAAVSDLVNILSYIYPVGSIYINASVSTNPATLFGFGTWVAYANGKAVFGLDAGGDTAFDSLADTGGAKTVTLTKGNIPAHVHGQQKNGSDGTVAGNFSAGTNASNVTAATGCDTLDGTADGLKASPDAVNILPPYVVAYMWKRTA